MGKTLKEIQTGLKKEIPYKWRVQSFSKQKAQATCVAYIDSRDVQNILDDNCEWSDRYYEENGMLFCEITIYADGREYKRSDTGSESNVDKEKGHSSDAFKRAAVKFGVGRFLYSLKMTYLPANEAKTNSNYPFVVDSSGKRVWDITKHIDSTNSKSQPKTTPPINFDRLKKRLEACTSLEQLQKAYTAFTPQEKAITKDVKDTMKALLTPSDQQNG